MPAVSGPTRSRWPTLVRNKDVISARSYPYERPASPASILILWDGLYDVRLIVFMQFLLIKADGNHHLPPMIILSPIFYRHQQKTHLSGPDHDLAPAYWLKLVKAGLQFLLRQPQAERFCQVALFSASQELIFDNGCDCYRNLHGAHYFDAPDKVRDSIYELCQFINRHPSETKGFGSKCLSSQPNAYTIMVQHYPWSSASSKLS